MVDADNFDVLQQVAHVFTSQQVLALQAKIKRDEELYEITRIAVCELSVDRFKGALAHFNSNKTKCNCFDCKRAELCLGPCDLSRNNCALAEEFGRLCAKHSVSWKLCPEYHGCQIQPKRISPWRWSTRWDLIFAHCEHIPTAHILTSKGFVGFRFGVLVWDITKIEDLRPLRDLITELWIGA
jgi:hypothetical protein